MKKITLLVVALLVVSVAFAACKKAADKPAEDKAEKVETKATGMDKVSQELSAALCKRMVDCVPEEARMPVDKCTEQTTASLSEALKMKPIEVDDDKLAACVKSINEGKCEVVMGTEPPTNCEFLK